MKSQAWMAYFDASALVKRYAVEVGTPVINEIFRLLPPASRACSVIGLAEITSVLVRKRNGGRIDQKFFEQASLKLGDEFLAQAEVLIASVNDDLILASITAAMALEDRAFFIRRVGTDGFQIRHQPTLKKVVNDRRASLDEEGEVRPTVEKLVQKLFEQGASIPLEIFPAASTAVPDSPRLTLVVADPEWEPSSLKPIF